jgi:hypothetical protein
VQCPRCVARWDNSTLPKSMPRIKPAPLFNKAPGSPNTKAAQVPLASCNIHGALPVGTTAPYPNPCPASNQPRFRSFTHCTTTDRKILGYRALGAESVDNRHRRPNRSPPSPRTTPWPEPQANTSSISSSKAATAKKSACHLSKTSKNGTNPN